MLKVMVHYIDNHSEEYNVLNISNLDNKIRLLRENGIVTYIPYNTFLYINITPVY